MRQGAAAFVDSGAWIALALSRDPLHTQAREQWDILHGAGAKLHTSVPVVIDFSPIAASDWFSYPYRLNETIQIFRPERAGERT